MTQPTSHREKWRVAHKATKDAERCKHGTLNPAAATAGRSSTDDRMDVAQSSASETDSIDAGSTAQGSLDEDILHFSPSQEMGAEAGPSSSCSARVTAVIVVVTNVQSLMLQWLLEHCYSICTTGMLITRTQCLTTDKFALL